MEGVHNYEETVKYKPTQWPTCKREVYVTVIQEIKERKIYYYKIVVSQNVTFMQL
jgi:hypothetical protein